MINKKKTDHAKWDLENTKSGIAMDDVRIEPHF